MCFANLRTMPCGHTRVIPTFCPWVIDHKQEDPDYIESRHPEPAVIKEYDNPAGQVCLCTMGVPLAADTEDDLGGMYVYRKANQDPDLGIFDELIVRPIRRMMEGEKSGRQDEAESIPEFAKLPGDWAEFSLGRARRLWVADEVFYSCAYPGRVFRTAKELSAIPGRCPRNHCHRPLLLLYGVTGEEPDSRAASQSQASGSMADDELWNITIYD